MISIRHTTGIAAIFVVTAASGAQQISDSAGAKIIRYGARDRAREQWTVDPKPLLRLGGAEGQGPTEFAQILGIARMNDGRLIVADGGSSELRVFSPKGEFVRSVGRRGSGPGEFDNGILLMYRSADSIVVHDRAVRLQVFTGDGTFLRSYPRPVFPGRSVSSWLGMLSDGTGVVQASDPLADTISDHRTQTASLGLRAPSATDARAFTQIPVFESVRHNGRYVGLFLGAVSRVGVMGERLCAGYSLRWEIRCFDRTGKLITRTVRDLESGPVTQADKDEFLKAYAAANKSQNPEALRNAMQMLQFADKRSAFGRFVPSATGELWIGPFVVLESIIPGRRGPATPDKPTTWTVIGADGRWSADVVLPARFSLLDAGRDYVAGIELDADDVETVVVYPLKRMR
jgi:hypothetical protein